MRRSRLCRYPLCGVFLLALLPVAPARAKSRRAPRISVAQAVKGTHGVVAAEHPVVAKVAAEILRAGGTAVDAACAAAFASGVVEPAASGLGGGGFMLVHQPGRSEALFLDFRETAPAAASRQMYLKPGVPKDASRRGGLAVGVPGEVRGCAEAIDIFGRFKLGRLLAPAMKLARHGFAADEQLVKTIGRVEAQLKEIPHLRRLFFTDEGEIIPVGHRISRPKLLRALRAIARHGPKAFYRGWIAKDLVNAVRKAGGILSMKDLAGYRTAKRKPLRVGYRGTTVLGAPPPSSGGIVISQALQVLARWDIRKWGPHSGRYLHTLAEVLKHTFADRARYLGDTDFVDSPISRLTSGAYANKIAGRVGEKVLADAAAYGSSKEAAKAPHRSAGTCHISVIDRSGMAVAMTTSLNTLFGSLVVAERSGIVLNDQMDDFTTRPGEANAYGLVQSEANTVAPGKRPLSSMSPTLVVRDDRAILSLGGSGGPRIITGSLQVLLNVVAFGMPTAAAVSAPRIHHQWMPATLTVEEGIPETAQKDLRRRGHKLKKTRRLYASVQAVSARAEESKGSDKGNKAPPLAGAGDPRRLNAAAAY